MPPQEKSPILSPEEITLHKQRQEESIARAMANKKAKEEKEEQAVREIRNSYPNIPEYDPEKHGNDGRSKSGNQGE